MNSKYRRMLNRLPEDIKTILEGLGSEYIVENYNPQYMGWSVDIVIKSKRFNLVKEWHQVFISEIKNEGNIHLWPEKDKKSNLELENVAGVINELIA
ncbi:hypothetical protein [Sulfuriflexus mobilis]|uniref:hypothetical protein n=1 Tax=Sulfuriflexus mobilis TaxID=1811807 RepID=UPI000F81BF8D|nr:hypothetical protein [Sulfuriflexus mobilis]